MRQIITVKHDPIQNEACSPEDIENTQQAAQEYLDFREETDEIAYGILEYNNRFYICPKETIGWDRTIADCGT